MTDSAIRAVVEQHSCEVFATRYSLRLEWVDHAQCGAPGSPTHLLRIELNAAHETTKAPMQLHLLVWLTQLSELPALLDDALHQHLFEQAITGAPERPWMAAMQRCAHALRPVWSYPLSRHRDGLQERMSA